MLIPGMGKSPSEKGSMWCRWLADKPELHFQLPEALRVVQDTTAAADIDEDDSRVGLYSGAAQTTGGGRKIMQPVA